MKHFSCQTLAFLFHQMASLTEAGIPLIDAWKLLLRDIHQQKQKQTLYWAVHQMDKGMAPSQAMERTGLFPSLACTIVVAGEHAGNLDAMFSLLGDYYEATGKQKRLIIEALSYPVFLLACTIMLVLGAVFFILPVFEDMFQQMNVSLPSATKCLLDAFRWLRTHGLIVLLTGLFTGGGLYWSWQHTDISEVWEQQLLSCKKIRDIYVMWCWQRFGHILSVQIASGIPLLQAIQDARQVVPVRSFRSSMFRVIRAVENGIPLSKAIHGSRWSTVFIETMLIVGETTGKYDEALLTISNYYGWRLERHMARLQQFLGPMVLLVVGLLMGIIILCLILPLMDMAASIAV